MFRNICLEMHNNSYLPLTINLAYNTLWQLWQVLDTCGLRCSAAAWNTPRRGRRADRRRRPVPLSGRASSRLAAPLLALGPDQGLREGTPRVTSFRPGVRRQRPSCGELPPQPGGTPCWVSGSWERRSVSIWQTQFVGRRLRPTTNARLKYSFWFTTYAFRYSL